MFHMQFVYLPFPQTLKVNVTDFTFTSVTYDSKHTPFAVGGACNHGGKFGKLKVNLTGTSFHVHPEVSVQSLAGMKKMKKKLC